MMYKVVKQWDGGGQHPFWTALAFAVCCGSSAEVWATCGDYLHIGWNAADAAARVDPGLPKASWPAPAVPPQPCNGPNCGRQVPVPVSPPSAPAPSRADELAVGAAPCDTAPPTAMGQYVEVDASAFPGHPFRLKRPPRA